MDRDAIACGMLDEVLEQHQVHLVTARAQSARQGQDRLFCSAAFQVGRDERDLHADEAAGGVAYDDATLHAILELPEVVGIKVATLDSVMTFQRIAVLMRSHPDKVLLTGEDRFYGYSVMAGATAALIGMGAALPDAQAELLHAFRDRQWERFVALSALCDRLAQATFIEPMEGYVRRMLWAAAAEGAIPREACDDTWGPALPEQEREIVEQVVADARAARP